MRSIAAPRHIRAQPAAKDANNSWPADSGLGPAGELGTVLGAEVTLEHSWVRMGR
jgi:hypothetical protein